MDGSPSNHRLTRAVRFLRQVRDELQKVTWPTRREVVVYTIVVMATVIVIGSLVYVLDQLFARLSATIFSG